VVRGKAMGAWKIKVSPQHLSKFRHNICQENATATIKVFGQKCQGFRAKVSKFHHKENRILV
jgi:hypothetical protein